MNYLGAVYGSYFKLIGAGTICLFAVSTFVCIIVFASGSRVLGSCKNPRLSAMQEHAFTQPSNMITQILLFNSKD